MSPISSIPATAVISNAADGGLATLSTGSRQLDYEAQQIADPTNPDVISAVVNTNQSLELAKAGADVISTSNEMLGTLLNIFA